MAALATAVRNTLRKRDSSLDGNNIPIEISDLVPLCAQSCLSKYIQYDYRCTSNSLSCLCSTYSSQGFTLGELAYGCLMLSCSQPSGDTQQSLYKVCSTYKSAVRPTHSALSLPPPSSTKSSSTKSTQSSTVTSTPTSSTTTSQPVITTSSSTKTASTTASNTAGAAALAVANAPFENTTELSAAQATGISIGAMGGLMAFAALIMFIQWIRKRRLRAMKPVSDSFDFVDKPPSGFPPAMVQRLRQNPFAHFAEYNQERRPASQSRRPTAWPVRSASRASASVRRWSRNLAGAADRSQRNKSGRSRKSTESTRTVSQLLPDKPEPSPLKAPANAVVVPGSPTTVIDDDPMSPRFMQTQLQPIQPPAKVYRVTNATPVRPPLPDKTSSDNSSQPSLSLEIPVMASRNLHPVSVHLKTTAYSSPRNVSNDTHRKREDIIEDNIPDYYTTDASHEVDPESPTPIDDGEQKRKVAPPPIRVANPTAPPRAVRVSSVASDTSFESNDSDDPTPPEDLAGDATASPFSTVRYPKIPRPSNQSVPRRTSLGSRQQIPASRPPVTPQKQFDTLLLNHTSRTPPDTRQVSPPSSRGGDVRTNTPARSNTLAAKRRGSRALHDLESGLMIVDSAHSHSKHQYAQHNISPSPATKVAQSSASKRYYHRVGNTYESPLRGYGHTMARPQPGRMPMRPPAPLVQPDGRGRRGGTMGTRHETVQEEERANGPAVRASPHTPKIRRQDVVLGSPMQWEPKITPTRRGDDLYLNVSLATPCATPKEPAWQQRI